MRARGLRHLLAQVYDEYLVQRLGPASAPEKEARKQEYLAALTRNHGVDDAGPLGFFGRWFARRGIDSLSTLEFARRLADTEVGRLVRARGALEVERLVDEAGRRFERFGVDASSYFRARAQLISAIAAIAVALALNIDAVRLFSCFLVDEELAAKIIATAPAIEEAHLARNPPATDAAEPRPPVAADTPKGQPPTDLPADQEAAAVGESFAELRAQLVATSALGLPIGRAYYPWCREAASLTAASPDTRCREAATADRYGKARLLTGWLLSTLLAGVLIALGGPFWFDAFKRLSALVDLRRALLGAESERQAASPVASSTPATPGEAFLEASHAGKPLPRRGRLLLTPDGRHDGRGAWRSR
jgi:hypothetical protein